ncbi:hypothetical protein GQ457_18G008460 [Hibiscus cannabinus]
MKSEADIDNNSEDPPDKAGKKLTDDEQNEPNELVGLPDKQECPLQAVSGDESYESDATELDVKVCDICGDAGREDLLAICSKCSDGAEHTYCMREMLQEVPEGDWICEECRLAEETGSQKQGLDGQEERANKLSSGTQSLGKRHAENLEGASALKKQAVEISMESPKSLNPSRVTALSRESSFKNLDKGKIRSLHQNSLGNQSGKNMLENVRSPTSGPQLRTPKGTLLKSNSFNTINSKPKVKLVDEIVLQKQKSARERASLGAKEEHTRMMGRSLSFKSTNLGRLNSGESKIKMLSTKYPHVQDLKGLKQVKERISLDRKNSLKFDRSSSTVSSPKVDQKLTPRADTISHSSASNNRESKVVESDGKPSTLSRSVSNLPHKSVENVVTSVVVSSTNGKISSEQKLNQISPKVEPSSRSSWMAERQPGNFSGLMSDVPSRLSDSTIQREKSNENSVSCSSKSVACIKCKEMGHTAENCSACQVSGADISATRTYREEINKGNKLKAAIEAAIRLRSGIVGRTSQDPSSVSSKARNMTLVEGTSEGQINLHNQASIGNMKRLNSHSTDAVSIVSSVGNLSMRDSSIPPLAAVSAVSKISAIPEHECIWQGAFEVHESGKSPDFLGGIQAHLSNLASPKVLEVVKTFPHKVHLNEVPRTSTWPSQFEENGPKEDNIALYFFAKDLESYEKHYKVLLDAMVKNDVALKGNLEGVELLIFPSNQLPENCQRWNTLLFLWGVFKGRKSNSSNFSNTACIPDASMMQVSTDIPLPVDTSCNVVPATTAVEKKRISTEWVGDAKEESKVVDFIFDSEHKPWLQATVTSIGCLKVEKEEMQVESYPSLKNRPFEKKEAVAGKIEREFIEITDSEDDEYADGKSSSRRDFDRRPLNNRKRPYLDLTETVLEISADTSEKMQCSEGKGVSVDGGSDTKRLKTGFSRIYQYRSGRDQSLFSDSLASDRHDPSSGNLACEENVMTKDMKRGEKFFPVDLHHARELQMGNNSEPWKELSIKDENRVQDASPNLELALGAETRPPTPNKGILPFFVGKADKSGYQDRPPDKETGKEDEEDDVSASLSLSLSFPFPEKDGMRSLV